MCPISINNTKNKEIEISRIENNLIEQNNTKQFIAKVPYTQTDDYGNEVTLYRKEWVTEENLTAQRELLQAQIDAIDSKLAKISELK